MSTPEATRFLPTEGTCATCGDVLVAEGENGTLTHASEENCPTQLDDHGAGCDGPLNCTCEVSA